MLRRRIITAAIGFAVLGTLATSASATPGSGVTGQVLAVGGTSEGVRVKQFGDTDVTVRVITIQPGGYTGWHYHPGQVIAVVQAGTLTRTKADCSVEVNGPGTSLVEPGGRRDVHIGWNLGTEPVVLYATYVLPKGSPLSIDAPDPGCPAPGGK